MTKRDLKQIYYIKKEIEVYEDELRELRYKSLAKGQQLTGMPTGSGTTSDQVGRLAVDIAETTKIIEGKIIELRKKEMQVYDFLGTIEDSWMRQIVYLRNVNLLSWNKIASKMGGNNNEGNVKVAYHRYINSRLK